MTNRNSTVALGLAQATFFWIHNYVIITMKLNQIFVTGNMNMT
jgi:hypothetical protein